MKRKLIEVSLPLEGINKQAAARGRPIRHDTAAPEAITDNLRDVIEEVDRHIASAPGAKNISIVLEVSAGNSDGVPDAGARTTRENSRLLGFNESGLEDVEW